jgi:hypothetical protein
MIPSVTLELDEWYDLRTVSATNRRAENEYKGATGFRLWNWVRGRSNCKPAFLGMLAFAQEMPRYVDPWLDTIASVDKNALSEEEYREYARLVEDIQRKLNNDAPFLGELQNKVQRISPAFGGLSTLIGRWFRSIDYVKAAQVERPLFLSDPPQIRVHLQIELKSKKIVRDDVAFSLLMKPRILY